jgi:hypothetical protein
MTKANRPGPGLRPEGKQARPHTRQPDEEAETLAAFKRLPTAEQGRWEWLARQVHGDQPQPLLLRYAAELWAREKR